MSRIPTALIGMLLAAAVVPSHDALAQTASTGGLLARAATPRNVVNRLYEGVASAIARPDVRERMLAGGLEPVGNAPVEFAGYLRAEVAKWAKVIRAAGIRVD